MLSEILLWLFVIWLAIQQGGGWYESLVVVPQWSKAPPNELEAALERTGQRASGYRFWPFVSPPVALLAIANAVAAWQVPSPRGGWWLAAAVLTILYSLSTYLYFVPNMFKLWRANTVPAAETERRLASWLHLNNVRQVAGALAFLAALKTLSMCG
jgi:Domain of unknown function (DUF1772)